MPLSTIWKYPVPIEDAFMLEMPSGAVPLSFGVQRGRLCLWAAVDEAEPGREWRRFLLRGTGPPHQFDFSLSRFIGTVVLDDLGLVFHLFDAGVAAAPVR